MELCANQVYAWIWIKDFMVFIALILLLAKTDDMLKIVIIIFLMILLLDFITPVMIGVLQGVC